MAALEKGRPSPEVESCIAALSAASYVLDPAILGHCQPGSVKTCLHSKVTTSLFISLRILGHMFRDGVFPMLARFMFLFCTSSNSFRDSLLGIFQDGIRENLFAHVNPNRFNMFARGEIPAGMRQMKTKRFTQVTTIYPWTAAANYMASPSTRQRHLKTQRPGV